MGSVPPDPHWQRSRVGRFHRLVYLYPEDEDLAGVSAVYVMWHGGSQPEWVFVGHTDDLAQALNAHADDPALTAYDTRGGLFVTWALIRDEYQPGVVRYLTAELKPVVENSKLPGDDVQPIAVLLPGGRSGAWSG
jgi:hypothetical protein